MKQINDVAQIIRNNFIFNKLHYYDFDIYQFLNYTDAVDLFPLAMDKSFYGKSNLEINYAKMLNDTITVFSKKRKKRKK